MSSQAVATPLQLLYPLEICAPPCESKPYEPELELEQSAGVTVTPGDGQNPSQENPQEDRSQVEAQCPLRRSRCAVTIEAQDRLMAQALSQTKDSVDQLHGQGGSVSCTV